MRKLTLIAACAGLLAGPALADPMEGVWKTKPDDNGHFGHIKVSECGPAVCGVLVKAFDSSGKPIKSENVGKRIIWDMKPQGGGKYAKGKIWSPDRNKTYNSKMQLNGNQLSVSGCVLGICRNGGTWTRVQ